MKALLNFLFGLWLCLVAFSAGAEVKNVRVTQLNDRVWVKYDLNEEMASDVSALIAVNNRLLQHSSLHITGDIGRDVSPGKDKQFSWEVLQDYPQGLTSEVFISLLSQGKKISENDIVLLSEQQTEIFRRIDTENIDVVAINKRTPFSGNAAKLVTKIDDLLNTNYYQPVDQTLMEKSRYYCARFEEKVGAHALGSGISTEEWDNRWESAKHASPVIGEENHAKYFSCVLNSLDPHSDYLTPDEFRDLKEGTTGVFGGLGIEVGMEKGRVKVISPIEDTPAFHAGIKAGDIIDKIDGTPTLGLTLKEAVKRMRGKPDTQITLTLERGEELQQVVLTLTRAVIKIQSVKSKLLEGGYGYVRITQFQEKTEEALVNTLTQLAQQNRGPLKGLVLDLRNNPGGLLNAAVGVAGAFLPPGQLVASTDGRAHNAKMKLSSRENKAPEWARSVPMVALVNRGSASASEIMAGALQDHQRAVVVGLRSFGKGSLQTVIPMGESAIKLTTALYFTPAGRVVQGSGITPDIVLGQDAASHDEAAAFSRRLLMTPGINNPETRRETADSFEIAEFFTLHKNAVRSNVAIAPAAALAQAASKGLPGRVEEPPEEHRVALVIGNAAYPTSPLRNPVNDARAVSAKLKNLGFQVTLRENVPLKEMMRAITQFGEQLDRKGTIGLFYYAGHGMQVRGKNYLIPVDAQISSEASVRSEAADADSLLEQLAVSDLGIVILDACRNNPFERRFRSGGGGGLAQMDAPKGTLIAYATAPGKVALDGDGRNGLFTQEFLKALDETGLKVEEVFKRVRRQVAGATRDQQIPWESSSLTGDFYFARAVPANPGRASSDAELLFWQSIKDSQDAGDFGSYLRNYPKGQFADIARNRLRKLKAK